MRLLGTRTIGLGYGLALTELIIAPAMPSITARAGGVMLPIVAMAAGDPVEGAAGGGAVCPSVALRATPRAVGGLAASVAVRAP